MNTNSNNKPEQIGVVQPKNPSHKPDSGVKPIVDGLILTPNYYVRNNSSQSQPKRNLTSVPRSTAALLSMAEEKIKAMSKTNGGPNNNPNSKKGGLMGGRGKMGGGSGNSVFTTTTTSRPKSGAKVKFLPPSHSSTSDHPAALKWLRSEEAESRKRATSRSRPSRSRPSPNKLKDIFGPEQPDKLITIGGYIINIEKGLPPQVVTSVRPSVTSNERGVEIEVRIREVDPAKIVVEKRYNSILVIGVKESGVKTKDKSNLQTKSETEVPLASPGLEDDVIEIVNIFAPRDVSLARVMVTPADSKGKLFIKAP